LAESREPHEVVLTNLCRLESILRVAPPMTGHRTPGGVNRHGRLAPAADRRDLGPFGCGPERAEVEGRGAAEAERPRLHRGGPVPGPHRLPVARPARAVRPLGCRVPAVPAV